MKTKAVLVIDKPTKCEECPLYVKDIMSAWCVLNIADIVDCPLKPLPKRKRKRRAAEVGGAVKNLIAIGYNRCLDDITDN